MSASLFPIELSQYFDIKHESLKQRDFQLSS